MKNKKSIKEDIKKIVIERIRASSGNLQIVVGGKGEKLSKQDLIDNVSKNNNLGKEIIRIQMEFLKAMGSGELYTTQA
ncbi:hypothetical protein KKG65_02045 [Patescibacteria group bacterium]|nr:hypothetical protein [Patescibacteria group bacterium]